MPTTPGTPGRGTSMIIRWLGAFGRGDDLATSLRYELTGPDREVAAEPLQCRKSRLHEWRDGMVGLLVARHAVRRHWAGDAYTQVTPSGRLDATRRPRGIAHHECACLPIYTAIVVRGRVTNQAFATARQAAATYNLPLLRLLPDGQTKEVSAT